jgi:hypothetical protein
MRMSKRLGTLVAIAGVVAVGLFALPHPAQAYWVWRGGVQVWVPAHWRGGYWVPGHWA